MSKEQLKAHISELKGHVCVLTQQPLPDLVSLYDTHREVYKAEGGTYTDGNTALAQPVAHMAEHGNYRERTEELNELKAKMDDRKQVLKLKSKLENQLLAYKRGTDHPRQTTVDFLQEQLREINKALATHDRKVSKAVRSMSDPLAQAALGVHAIGPITVAYCQVHIEVAGIFPEFYPGTNKPHPKAGQEKAPHASSLWKYVGLHTSSWDRYQKNVASGGNKNLRTVLYTMAESQMKHNGPYREVYDRAKARRAQSNEMVWTRNTQGKLVQLPWKETKSSHRHGDALRQIMKHFLADYWYVGRVIYGLPTNPLYPEAVLGAGHRTIKPEERGWNY